MLQNLFSIRQFWLTKWSFFIHSTTRNAPVCDVYCNFVSFPFGILGQVWYLIVSIPDPCCLLYFKLPLQTNSGRHTVISIR